MTHFFIVIICFFTFFHIYAPQETKLQTTDDIIFHWIGTFAEVVDLVQKKHYKPEPMDEAMKKAIKGFVTSFDPHTAFLDEENYKELLDSTSGVFFGIGIVIDNTRREKEKALLVTEVIDGGPADKAGIQPNDKIVEVNGKALEGISTEKIISMIKGEKNSKVTLKILRDNQPDLLTITVTRDVVKEQQSLCFLLKDHHIYYLSLTMFSDTSMQQMQRLLKHILETKSAGLVLDLRNNSGGLLSSVLDICSLFLPKQSVVVTTKNNKGEVLSTYCTEKAPLTTEWNIPIIILVNHYTASAAEILAGALQFYAKNNIPGLHMHSVLILGEQTFGKGSVQEIIPMSNNCAIKITTTLYFLPDGNTIQGEGIVPDILIKRTLPETEQSKWLTTHYGREAKLPNSINIGKKSVEKKELSKEKDDSEKKSRHYNRIIKMVESDNQLQEAVRLINLINQATKKSFLISQLPTLFAPINVDSVEEIK